MNWTAIAAALGLAIPGDQSARAVVLAHLGLAGNASNEQVQAALAGGADAPGDNVVSIVARRKPRDIVARGDWWQVRAQGDDDEAEVLIYGDIGENFWGEESVTARSLVNELRDISAPVIRVRINSFGGTVHDGLAIHNALRRHAARIIVEIDGYAVSVASLIAMAGDTVRISENAMVMVHAPLAGLFGWFNARDLDRFISQLDTHSLAMLNSYARKTGKGEDEILALLSDGEDHWFTAAEAVAFGLADEVSDALAIAAHLQIPDRFSRHNPAATSAAHQPAQEYPMNWIAIAAALGLSLSADADQKASKAAVMAHLSLEENADDAAVMAALRSSHQSAARAASTPVPASPPANPAEPAPTRAQVLAEEQQRRQGIRQAFASFRGRPGVDDLLDNCLDDTNVTADGARTRLLAHLGQGAEPLNAGVPRVSAGDDQTDRIRTGMVHAVLARRGVTTDPVTNQAVDGSGANPWRGYSTREIARACLQAAGHRVEGMDPDDIARAALGSPIRAGMSQTQSDFPVILESLIQREVLVGFRTIEPTFMRFCRIGDVTDLREWQRLVPGVIAQLEEVNEHGEYNNKNIPDAEKQTIQAKRRGNIIAVTPDAIINDQLGLVLDTAQQVGMAGGRTTERLVYARLDENGGDGPNLRDGNPVFATGRGNKASSLGAPDVEKLAAAADAMAEQKAPGEDQEFLDIQPAVSLSRHNVARDIQVLVNSQYDPDAANKLQRPNKVRGIVGDIVGSPRVTGTRWYLFADPTTAPVFEVVYLNGQREPRVVQEEVFRTGGMQWRADMAVGVGAVGFRGGFRGG